MPIIRYNQSQFKMRIHTVALTLITIAICRYVHFVKGKNDIELVYENATCRIAGTSGIATKFDCSLSKSAKRRTIGFEMQLSQPINRFSMNLLVVLPRKGGDFVLLNLTNYQGCSFLANRDQVTLLQLTRSTLDRYSNLPKKCPFLKDTLYFVRGFRLDMDMLPAFSFETNFIAWFDIAVARQKIGLGEIRVRFVKKSNRKG